MKKKKPVMVPAAAACVEKDEEIHETAITGPGGEQATVVSIEDDIQVHEVAGGAVGVAAACPVCSTERVLPPPKVRSSTWQRKKYTIAYVGEMLSDVSTKVSRVERLLLRASLQKSAAEVSDAENAADKEDTDVGEEDEVSNAEDAAGEEDTDVGEDDGTTKSTKNTTATPYSQKKLSKKVIVPKHKGVCDEEEDGDEDDVLNEEEDGDQDDHKLSEEQDDDEDHDDDDKGHGDDEGEPAMPAHEIEENIDKAAAKRGKKKQAGHRDATAGKMGSSSQLLSDVLAKVSRMERLLLRAGLQKLAEVSDAEDAADKEDIDVGKEDAKVSNAEDVAGEKNTDVGEDDGTTKSTKKTTATPYNQKKLSKKMIVPKHKGVCDEEEDGDQDDHELSEEQDDDEDHDDDDDDDDEGHDDDEGEPGMPAHEIEENIDKAVTKRGKKKQAGHKDATAGKMGSSSQPSGVLAKVSRVERLLLRAGLQKSAAEVSDAEDAADKEDIDVGEEDAEVSNAEDAAGEKDIDVGEDDGTAKLTKKTTATPYNQKKLSKKVIVPKHKGVCDEEEDGDEDDELNEEEYGDQDDHELSEEQDDDEGEPAMPAHEIKDNIDKAAAKRGKEKQAGHRDATARKMGTSSQPSGVLAKVSRVERLLLRASLQKSAEVSDAEDAADKEDIDVGEEDEVSNAEDAAGEKDTDVGEDDGTAKLTKKTTATPYNQKKLSKKVIVPKHKGVCDEEEDDELNEEEDGDQDDHELSEEQDDDDDDDDDEEGHDDDEWEPGMPAHEIEENIDKAAAKRGKEKQAGHRDATAGKMGSSSQPSGGASKPSAQARGKSSASQPSARPSVNAKVRGKR